MIPLRKPMARPRAPSLAPEQFPTWKRISSRCVQQNSPVHPQETVSLFACSQVLQCQLTSRCPKKHQRDDGGDVLLGEAAHYLLAASSAAPKAKAKAAPKAKAKAKKAPIPKKMKKPAARVPLCSGACLFHTCSDTLVIFYLRLSP